MLFWLFVIILVIGIACIIVGRLMYEYSQYDTDWLRFLGITITLVMSTAVIICGIVLMVEYSTADANVELNKQRYESLTYQLENNLYENDNDLGKKQLYDEIREWNEELAYRKEIQDDFWIGIFYPNVFDQFEFIAYS
jgi:hypothetical protein